MTGYETSSFPFQFLRFRCSPSVQRDETVECFSEVVSCAFSGKKVYATSLSVNIDEEQSDKYGTRK